jgi:DNA-binding CsgD family transcriptional regulator
MARLLGRLAAAQRTGRVVFPAAVPQRYLDRLLRAFQPAAPAGAAPPATGDTETAGLAESLSGRELEVLRLLAAGKSNQQIADELVVTLATVKKHVGHILGKLAAANRTQAVARARVLGLLRLGQHRFPAIRSDTTRRDRRFYPQVDFRLMPSAPAEPNTGVMDIGLPRDEVTIPRRRDQ